MLVRRPAAFAIALLAAAALLLLIPALRWRAEALTLVLGGRIPDLTVRELLPLMRPGSGQNQLSRLIGTHNPYAVIHIPADQPRDLARGARLFAEQCASCHAPDGSGGPGAPALVGRELRHGDTEWALYRTIRDGVPGTPMAAHPLTAPELWDVVAYVRSLGALPEGRERPSAESAALAALDVPYAELARTEAPAGDWLTYSGAYPAHRHSSLSQIDTRNVGRLVLRWLHQFEGVADRLESSPIVRGGIMYVTGPGGRLYALDARSGREIWSFVHPYVLKGGGEGPLGQNRGVAILDRRIFLGTWDSKLVALAADTGQVLWESRVGDYPGTYISGAPLALRDLVVVGIGSPPGFGRGFIAAFDAVTGRERWRFQTVPGPGERGHETWAGESWRKGGAGSWMTGAYDPQTDTLYWGIGNPRPDFEPQARAGDNLYSNSVVALRGSTGELLWYFQFTPGDSHDWDSSQVPIIAGSNLLFANRNGFYYVLDRATGKFLRGVPFVRVNWASSLDASGRPILAVAGGALQGSMVYPGAKGGTNWWPPSYDPSLDRVFVPALEQGMVFFPSPHTLPTTAARSLYTAVRALDARSGALLWEFRHPARTTDPNSSGLLSTAGGLVFGADHGGVFALDARNGQLLWSVESGGTTYAPPIAFEVSGEELITLEAGRVLMAFGLPRPAAATSLAGSSP